MVFPTTTSTTNYETYDLVNNFKAQWSSQQQQAQRTVPLDLAAARLVKTNTAL